MKVNKNFLLGLVGVTTISVGLFACSNDESSNQQQEMETQQTSNLQSKPAKVSDEGYSYALNFYSSEISLGRSIDLIDPSTNEGVTVTEVKVYGDDSRARGYIVNKVENNDFLYFADVNRSTDVLTIYEKSTGETIITDNLMESPDYLSTNKFDVIEHSSQYVTQSVPCGFWTKMMGKCEFQRRQFIPGPDGSCSWGVYDVSIKFFLFIPYGGKEDYNHNEPC